MSRAPQGLLGIGEFARLTGLSVKTIRHYHRLGVLLPAYVHPVSGYRYYARHQAAGVEDCRALMLVGVPLRRVRELVRGGMRTQDLRATLLEARERAGERIRAEAARLSWLESSIAAVERTGPGASGGSADERVAGVDLAAVEAQPIAALREGVADIAAGDALRDELAASWGPGDHVRRRLAAATVWHDCGRVSGQVDCEAVIASSGAGHAHPGPSGPEVRTGVLEAALVVRVRPAVAAASVGDLYLAGWRRLASLGLPLAAPVREWVRYARDESRVTEIHFPVARL